MLRKLALVGVVLVFERGSVTQNGIALVMSFFFLAAQMHYWPYKTNADNWLRASTELHVCFTIAVALMFQTGLDNPHAAEMARSPDSLLAREKHNHWMEVHRARYDMFLVVTFGIFVVGAFVATTVVKVAAVSQATKQMTHGQRLATSSGDYNMLMKAAYTRFQLGLATGSDHKDLVDFIDQLDVNQHERAGKRLWRQKQLVAHFSREQMGAMLIEIEEQLPKSQCVGVHFTDMDAARVILDQSQGLRASSVGQLGGGVSICLASLIDMGWGKHGLENFEFCQKVGDELWGSKAYEVLPGSPPAGAHPDFGKYHNKLEVALLVRIPSV